MRKNVVVPITVTIILLLSLFSAVVPAKAAGWCSCVSYVKNHFGIPESVGNAYQMGTWLSTHGFVRIYTPEVGAIAVMQPGFPGADKTYGHVGIINGVADWGSQWKITLKGANQLLGGGLFTEFDCTNVRNTAWSAYGKTSSGIAYYRMYKYAVRSAVTRAGYSNLYFDVTNGATSSGAYLLGWTYHGAMNQLFSFVQYGSEYRIIARNSGMCVQPQSNYQGARLVQKKCTNAAIEKWQRIYTSSGYILKNSTTSLVADLNNGSLSPGTTILVWGSHNGINQRWWLDRK
jgi:surface antigen